MKYESIISLNIKYFLIEINIQKDALLLLIVIRYFFNIFLLH